MLKKTAVIVLGIASCVLLNGVAMAKGVAHKAVTQHVVPSMHNFNINQASASDWQDIKGIGAKRAQAIVRYQAQHGRFTSVSDLQKIRGISSSSLANIQKKNHVHFMLTAQKKDVSAKL